MSRPPRSGEPVPPDAATTSVEDLRAARDDLLARAEPSAERPAALPPVWVTLAEWSYRIATVTGDEADLRVAERVLSRAASTAAADGEGHMLRIALGHVLAVRAEEQQCPDTAAEAERWLVAGLTGLTGASGPEPPPEHADACALARRLLAELAAVRADRTGAAADLDSAVERAREALEDQEPDTEEALDLHHRLGSMLAARGADTATREDLALAARHHGAALAQFRSLFPPGSPDRAGLPYFHAEYAAALLVLGRVDRDPRRIAAAAEAGGAALAAARASAPDGRPDADLCWFVEADLACAEALLWWQFGEQDRLAPAAERVRRLAGRRDTEDLLPPVYLEVFGRVLAAVERNTDGAGAERSGHRQAAGQRAVELLRAAVRRWRPGDGPIARPALFLAEYQHLRRPSDPAPAGLLDIARAAQVVLDTAADPDQVLPARLLRLYARDELIGCGVREGSPADRVSFRRAVLAGADEALPLTAARGTGGRGRTDPDPPGRNPAPGSRVPASGRRNTSEPDPSDPGEFEKWVGEAVAPDGDPEDAPARLVALWRRTTAGEGDRARLAGLLLQEYHRVDRGARTHDADTMAELSRAALDGAHDDAERCLAHLRAGGAYLYAAVQAAAPGAAEAAGGHLRRAVQLAGARGLREAESNAAEMLSAAEALAGQERGAADRVDTALEGLLRAAEEAGSSGGDPMHEVGLRAQAALVAAYRAASRNDPAALSAALADLEALSVRLDPADPAAVEIRVVMERLRLVRDHLGGAGAVPSARLPGRSAAVDPASHPDPDAVRRAAAALGPAAGARLLGEAGVVQVARAMALGARSATVPAAVPDAAPDAFRDALRLLRDAVSAAEDGSADWMRYAAFLALCLSRSTGPPGESRRARVREQDAVVALTERVLRYAGGPEHPHWGEYSLLTAVALRHRGDRARDDHRRARAVAAEGLRGYAYAALLQSATGHAAEIGARASFAAAETAGWCLADGAPDEAVSALEGCRGLVLHAAVTARTVPDRLTAAGRPDLAARWRAAARPEPEGDGLGATGARSRLAPLLGAGAGPPDGDVTTVVALLDETADVPSGLRRDVLAVLTGPGAAADAPDRLTQPPGTARIAGALRVLGHDALVYLVPATRRSAGAAVLVSAGGTVHGLPLPLLKADAEPLAAYAPGPVSYRDLGPGPGGAAGGPAAPAPGPGGGGSLRRRLDRLAAWAGPAALEPLLAALPDLLRPVRAGGRPGAVHGGAVNPAGTAAPLPRLLLVPLGPLAAVPWHAARVPGADGRPVHALDRAEISYAASARLVCEVAERAPVRLSGTALVVGDPTGDLRYAGEEAAAVRLAHYPRGRYLGRPFPRLPAEGPGTGREVLDWLGSPQAEGGVLHLACHATIAENARHSACLALHGGELPAETLTAAGRATGQTPRPALVVLAACRSHVSGRGPNEAYSLATAFQVAGADTVVGSLWPVPDEATSLLMFMLHHCLRTEGLSPGRALRSAQSWMRAPDRRLPVGMPAELGRRARDIDPEDLTAWAGFTHLGR
ncbi:CHAT domain-containing protein [Streptomyces sp. NPDC093094]|uniref:CHAT domain-containing protein n=1 Tax=Streptomyces sp. NPDC093094 TaxID=3366026 RepID=UPI0037F5E64F